MIKIFKREELQYNEVANKARQSKRGGGGVYGSERHDSILPTYRPKAEFPEFPFPCRVLRYGYREIEEAKVLESHDS